MQTVDPTTVLCALNGNPIRKIGIDWRDALSTVAAIAARQPGLSTSQAVEQAAKVFGEAEGALTLGDAVVEALLSSKQAQECPAREKLRRWELAKRFARNGVLELVAEDVVFVGAALGEHYKPSIYGPAYDALNRITACAVPAL